jgi:hypothetical protein
LGRLRWTDPFASRQFVALRRSYGDIAISRLHRQHKVACENSARIQHYLVTWFRVIQDALQIVSLFDRYFFRVGCSSRSRCTLRKRTARGYQWQYYD